MCFCNDVVDVRYSAYHHVMTIPIMIFSHLTVLPLTFLILVEGVFFFLIMKRVGGEKRVYHQPNSTNPAFYYGLNLPACVSISGQTV